MLEHQHLLLQEPEVGQRHARDVRHPSFLRIVEFCCCPVVSQSSAVAPPNVAACRPHGGHETERPGADGDGQRGVHLDWSAEPADACAARATLRCGLWGGPGVGGRLGARRRICEAAGGQERDDQGDEAAVQAAKVQILFDGFP
eukprot:scaffold2930_cov105-Isochrysis_galbana.AAC.8